MVKRTLSFGFSAFLVLAFLLTVQIESAHAYIDLGTGSFLLQMLLASAFAFLFMIKAYWRRFIKQVSRFFAKFKTKKANVD